MYKILFLLFVFPVLAFSQTKTETDEWIISKFNKWKQPIFQYDSTFGTLENTVVFESLKINSCDITITSMHQTVTSVNGKIPTHKKITIIKIGDIEELEWHDNQLFIESRKWNVLVKTFDDYTKKLENEKYVKALRLCFNTKAEDDLKNRISKAFNHLKTFCEPTSDKKEAF